MRRHLGERMQRTRDATEPSDDFKTRLQEQMQATLQATPRYRIVSTTGPAHARKFKAEVLVDGQVLGQGRGSSRKQAEQAAARRALLGDDA